MIQYSEKNTANEEGCGVINLSEGILNCINDMSYPGHDTPELNPVIKLCCDLLQEKEHHGYFYANDQKVLIDIAVREIHNIPFNQDSVETRYRFLQLLHDLMLSLEMKYRSVIAVCRYQFIVCHLYVCSYVYSCVFVIAERKIFWKSPILLLSMTNSYNSKKAVTHNKHYSIRTTALMFAL